MNWVQRRARQSCVLAKEGEELWHEISFALQDVCEDYNALYCNPDRPEVEYRSENGNRLRIRRTIYGDRITRFTDKKLHATVMFSADFMIVVSIDTPPHGQLFQLRADENSVVIVDKDETLSIDGLSQRILEPLLFPHGESRKAISDVHSI